MDTSLRLLLVSLSSLCALAAHGDNTATHPVPKDSERWMARHESMNRRAQEGNVDLVFIGDSIVENWEDDGKAVWDRYYGHRNAMNLGIGGDRTEHVIWRLDHGNIDGIHPKLAVVMIGQNNGGHNTAEEIAEGVTAIVNQLREKLPDTKILLLGIFMRNETPNEERVALATANRIVSGLDDGEHVVYRDITGIYLRPDGTIPAALMPDFEHPNEAGFRAWAEAIEPDVARLMGDEPVSPAAP